MQWSIVDLRTEALKRPNRVHLFNNKTPSSRQNKDYLVLFIQLENIWKIAEIICLGIYPNILVTGFTPYLSKIQLSTRGTFQVFLIDKHYLLVQNDLFSENQTPLWFLFKAFISLLFPDWFFMLHTWY